MLSEVFYWFLNMSITATVTGGVIFLLGKIKKLPRRLCFFLWAIPFLRLWIPFAPVSEYGFMELITRLSTRTVVLSDTSHTMAVTNHMAFADSYYPFEYRDALIERVFHISSIIWLLVAVCIIIILTWAYISTKNELKDAEHHRDNIWFSNKVHSPAVYGIFHPKIVLPMEYKGRDNTFVLMHENIHIKRMDNMWRVLAFAAAAIHWFNPLIWLFLKSFLTEMELACDEKVLSQCENDERKAYAFALIESAEMRSKLVSTFAGGKLNKRIEHILGWKRMSLFAAVCIIAFAIALAWALMTNPI